MTGLGAVVDPDSTEQPALAACYGASVQGLDVLGPRAGQPTFRLVDPAAASAPPSSPSGTGPPAAVSVEGFNVQARVSIDGRDRKRLERLCRYVARPRRSTRR